MSIDLGEGSSRARGKGGFFLLPLDPATRERRLEKPKVFFRETFISPPRRPAAIVRCSPSRYPLRKSGAERDIESAGEEEEELEVPGVLRLAEKMLL